RGHWRSISLTGTAIGGPAPASGSTWSITSQATNTVKLNPGGLTSVSAGGNTILYGFTQSGSWYYNANPSDSTNAALVSVTAPPAKLINLNGRDISVAPGATINASGGGDLFAGAFGPGTGGSENIFAGANKYLTQANVYAVIPGYAGITPYDPYISNTSTSFIGPSVGKQVYLNGIPGLPAGTYTLLPGPYAELPGAFLVTVNTSPGAKTVLPTQAPIRPVQQTDGSYLVSGYM